MLNKLRAFKKFLPTILIVVLLGWFIAGWVMPTSVSSVQDESSEKVTQQQGDLTPSNSHSPLTRVTRSYQDCKVLLLDYEEQTANWFRENYEGWDKFLDEGYSLDEVTLAIDYFGNPNFAAIFRVEQLRKNSRLSTFEKMVNRLFYQMAPDEFVREHGIRLVKAVPIPELKDFAALPALERQERLKQVEASVDDVAFFMADPNTPESVILELLSTIENPSEIVGYSSNIEAISLLDFAIAHSRAEVVSALLSQDLTPTSDAYLGSSMEWALSQLSRSKSKEDSDSRVKIVQLLHEYGAKAQFYRHSAESVEGHFPRRFYSFTAEKIASLYQDYGLDLTAIEPLQKLKVDPSSPLIERLQQERDEYSIAYLKGVAELRDISVCENTVASLDVLWDAPDAISALKAIQAQYPDASKENLETKLAEEDPVLVDVYRRDIRGPKHQYFKQVGELLATLRNSGVDALIAQATELNLSNAKKYYLFQQVVIWRPGFYQAMVESDLLTEEIPYFSYRWFRLLKPVALEELKVAGADLYSSDKRGKTLLYYAAKENDIALLKYMAEESYPYMLEEVGEDPLHVALNIQHSHFSLSKLPTVIDILMGYGPSIDKFHLKRMAAIRLYYPDTYDQIVAAFPELTVEKEHELPKVKLPLI